MVPVLFSLDNYSSKGFEAKLTAHTVRSDVYSYCRECTYLCAPTPVSKSTLQQEFDSVGDCSQITSSDKGEGMVYLKSTSSSFFMILSCRYAFFPIFSKKNLN